jgi:hypothetical protein
MNIDVKRFLNHDKRWNIKTNHEDNLFKFKNRLLITFNRLLEDFLVKNQSIDKDFFETIKLYEAKRPEFKESFNFYSPLEEIKKIRETINTNKTDKGFGDTHLYQSINNCKTTQELATVLQIFFWILEKSSLKTSNKISELVAEVKKLSSLTPSVSFQIHKRRKQVIIYPHGDEFLDREIIDYTLSGLDNYPEVADYFERALKIYQVGEKSQYRNLLDDLRFALEQLLKKVFKNQKALENQKEELLKWLKSKGINQYVIDLYRVLLEKYCKYQNEAVKHNEDFSSDEVEFIIYLTGNFMRLILQLEK